MFSKPLFMIPTRTTDGSEERDDFPCFELKFDFLKRFSEKPLTLTSTGNRRISGRSHLKKMKLRKFGPVEQLALKIRSLLHLLVW